MVSHIIASLDVVTAGGVVHHEHGPAAGALAQRHSL
jgi:ribulose 1,5-bisphosphate carboxylase large subunit-like protein